MINDSADRFEDLSKSYPELMEKSNIGDAIGVGDGWFDIIDALCENIYRPLFSAKCKLKAAIEYPRDDNGAYLSACEVELNIQMESLPEIVDIKEKFGGLRFYTYNTTERVEDLISFAESMAERTCEVCGSRGRQDNYANWIKTLCETHSRKPKDTEIQDGKIPPKFQDGEV